MRAAGEWRRARIIRGRSSPEQSEKREQEAMNQRAQIRMLADGRRLHLHDGPIDLIVEAFGRAARSRGGLSGGGRARFVTVLDELCGELSFLRTAVLERMAAWPQGAVARRMVAAVMPYASRVLHHAHGGGRGCGGGGDSGGDGCGRERFPEPTSMTVATLRCILSPGEKFVVGMVERPIVRRCWGRTTLHSADPVRGIATSGWRGRSFSLGIADAVTVLADRAAAADAAATIIANAVDLPGHPAIVRVPACELAPDSDLGDRLVTQAVGRVDLSGNESGSGKRERGLLNRLLRMGLIRVGGAESARRNASGWSFGRVAK